MKTKYFPLLVFALAIIATACSQKMARYENEEYIFWQPGVQIGMEDYQESLIPDTLNEDELWRSLGSKIISFQMVVDCPEDENLHGEQIEKLYIAPVFCKKACYNYGKDTNYIKIDQLCFDIAEYCVRKTKESYENMANSQPKAYGLYIIVFDRMKEEIYESYKALSMKYFQFANFNKEELHAYEKTRSLVDSLLQVTKDYATTPEDCKRFTSKAPLIKGYIKAPIIFDINKKDGRGQQ